MSEKRFSWDGDILFDNLELRELGNCLEARDIADLLNEQQEEIIYWKHRVSSLLMILSQFDNEKVKKLLEELDV